MPEKLSISIVIPAYNEEHHLQSCLESIATQTVMPNEVIVVDNNSTDKTAEIARSFPFARVVQEKKQGIVFARNHGFDLATSDLIGRIDTDTRLPTNWVSQVKQYYADPAHQDFSLTGGGYFYNLPMGKFYGWLQGQIAFRANRLITGHYILWGSNMVIPRTSWQKIKPSLCTRTDIHEDVDLAIHLHQGGYQITYHENLRVGVQARRVFSRREELKQNLFMWPTTLKVHGGRRWLWGWLGATALMLNPFFWIHGIIAKYVLGYKD